MARPAAQPVPALARLAVVAGRPGPGQPRHPDAAEPPLPARRRNAWYNPFSWFLPHETYLVTEKQDSTITLAEYVREVVPTLDPAEARARVRSPEHWPCPADPIAPRAVAVAPGPQGLEHPGAPGSPRSRRGPEPHRPGRGPAPASRPPGTADPEPGAAQRQPVETPGPHADRDPAIPPAYLPWGLSPLSDWKDVWRSIEKAIRAKQRRNLPGATAFLIPKRWEPERDHANLHQPDRRPLSAPARGEVAHALSGMPRSGLRHDRPRQDPGPDPLSAPDRPVPDLLELADVGRFRLGPLPASARERPRLQARLPRRDPARTPSRSTSSTTAERSNISSSSTIPSCRPGGPSSWPRETAGSSTPTRARGSTRTCGTRRPTPCSAAATATCPSGSTRASPSTSRRGPTPWTPSRSTSRGSPATSERLGPRLAAARVAHATSAR